MSETGRQLADRGQLLGPQDLALLFLDPGHHLAHPVQDRFHLPIQLMEIALGGEPDRAQLLIEMSVDVLNADAEAGDGSAQSPGHAEAPGQAAEWAKEGQQEQGPAGVTDHLLAGPAEGLHGALVQGQQFLAGLDQIAEGMSVGPLEQVLDGRVRGQLPRGRVHVFTIVGVAVLDLLQQVQVSGLGGSRAARFSASSNCR